MSDTKIRTLTALTGTPVTKMTIVQLLRGMATVCLLPPDSASVDRASVFSSIMLEASRRDGDKVNA